jgi:NAD(P)H-hydrate epimerase
MKYAVDSKRMKMIDDYTVNTSGIPAMELMERAANKLVSVMQQRVVKEDRILAVCGPGNNGGDGVAAGRILFLQGYHVAILFIGEENKCSPQMKAQLEMAKNLGIPLENRNKLSEYNIIIDALFGVGLSKPITGDFEEIIRNVNGNQSIVYSVDLPSGISAEDGTVMNVAVKANETVTFGYNKIGLLLYPGAEYAGVITVADIGFPVEAAEQARPDTIYYQKDDLQLLPKRKNYSHKGTYGKVLIVAGSKGMAGAACLSAQAAYRSGAGLVKVVTSECNRIILQTKLPEALYAAYDDMDLDDVQRQQQLLADIAWATVIVVGPGLGLSKRSMELVETVISNAKVPIIVDADAITLLSRRLEDISAIASKRAEQRFSKLSELLPAGTILTPHLMELSRIVGLPVSDIANNLIDTVRQCSYNNKLICAIKDARTIVAKGNRYYINVSGNQGMATGGSGDVLTGIIAAMVAQGMEPYEATCLAVYIHGMAGDEAAKNKGSYSMMASDIVGSIEKVFINYEY